jgi:hypothetical protein
VVEQVGWDRQLAEREIAVEFGGDGDVDDDLEGDGDLNLLEKL